MFVCMVLLFCLNVIGLNNCEDVSFYSNYFYLWNYLFSELPQILSPNLWKKNSINNLLSDHMLNLYDKFILPD